MCKVNNQWCKDIVKWYAPKQTYRLYCKAHGFKDQPYVTFKEVEYFRKHRPDLISANDPWNIVDPHQTMLINRYKKEDSA